MLKKFSNDTETINQIARHVASNQVEGIPIKNLTLAIELSLWKSNGILDFDKFVEALDSISGNQL